MTRRTYGQFCGLAHALDVVGERWTLLIVRELTSGPKRYSQLAEALAGIGTSLLAARMRQLESDDVIRRRLLLEEPGNSVVYELTDTGHELARAMMPLALWGARHHMADADTDHETYRPEWSLNFLALGDPADVPSELNALYAFDIDGTTACLTVSDGRAAVAPEPATRPADVTIRTTAATIAAIAGRRITLAEAFTQGQLTAEGSQEALTALLTLAERRLSRHAHVS